jgi:ferrous-iron efflux pump FieF
MSANDRIIAMQGKLMRLAALAAVATGVFLVAVKAAAFFLTGSIAMLASLADSGLDIIGSSVNLLAVRQALTPADREHRFGHGKAEPMAGLVQGAFIAASALFLVVEAVERLIEPKPVENGVAGLIVMAISIAAAAALVRLQKHVVKRTGSVAIDADRMHYLADILINVGVIVALVLSTGFGVVVADPVIALILASVLAGSSWRVLRTSYDQLMDREFPEAQRETIKTLVLKHAEVRALHDLRTRSAGMTTFIQVHLELDPELTLMQAHAVSDAVEADLQGVFPNAEIIIHEDPAGLETVADLAKT